MEKKSRWNCKQPQKDVNHLTQPVNAGAYARLHSDYETSKTVYETTC